MDVLQELEGVKGLIMKREWIIFDLVSTNEQGGGRGREGGKEGKLLESKRVLTFSSRRVSPLSFLVRPSSPTESGGDNAGSGLSAPSLPTLAQVASAANGLKNVAGGLGDLVGRGIKGAVDGVLSNRR